MFVAFLLFPLTVVHAENRQLIQQHIDPLSRDKNGCVINDMVHLISVDNASDLTPIREIQFQPWELVTAVDISPDGLLLAISAGNSIYLIDINTGKKLSFVQIHSFSHAISFNHNGEKLIVGSRDGYIREWLVSDFVRKNDPIPLLEIEAHKKGVNSVKYAPNDTMIVSGGNDAVTRVWSESTGELLNILVGGTFSVSDLGFDPVNEKLAIINGDTLRVRELLTGNILGTFVADAPLYHLAFQPLGKLIAVSDLNNHVLLWNVDDAFHSGKEKYPEAMVLTSHNGEGYATLVWDIAFNSKGSVLVSAGGDQTLRIWNPENGSLLSTLLGHQNAVTNVVFSPDDSLLFSVGLDAKVIFWKVR